MTSKRMVGKESRVGGNSWGEVLIIEFNIEETVKKQATVSEKT